MGWSTSSRTRHWRRVSAAGVVAAIGATALIAATAQHAAADAPPLWTGASGAGAQIVSTGQNSAPQFTYSVDPAGFGLNSWTFNTVALTTGTVTVPYHYTGFHAYFQVTVSLSAFVTGDVSNSNQLLVADGPVNCCTPPSGGFTYDGTATFNVNAGDTYGFTMTGSNFDFNNVLTGTLTLPTIGFTDAAQVAANTSWATAAPLTSAGVDGTLDSAGQARWYKFPVTPSSQVSTTLSNLDQNYDLTMYSDIGAEFTALASTSSTADLNTLGAEQTGNAFSPSIYSPSIYSPSIYSPSIYSPSIYSPSIYSPSIYSPSIYSPSIYSPSIYSPSDAFLQAFSAAQSRSLIGISAQDGTAPETISTATWNNTGFFYVRVQGRNGVDSPTPFHLSLSTTGGPCTGITLNTYGSDSTLTGTAGGARAVILTDSSRLTPTTSLTTDLNRLAAATGGVVVDVSHSQRVTDLNRQADANKSCSYAKNLVAQGIRDIVNSYRNATGTLQYVVIVGGDGVIPFFRYPDQAGLGPENNYVPPVINTSASQASLQTNDVLGQDAYGAASDLTLKGSVLPVPDVAVGRLVETASEIDGQITQFLGLTNQTLPTPHSSLVTGYDFLTSAADTVEGDLSQGLGSGARNDQLITNQGVPTTVTTGPSGPSRTTSWTATDLSNAMFSNYHSLVFLAGHFSANNTLAADYSTTLATTDVAAHPTAFTNSLVFSAGCHSGYNIVDGDGVPGVTLGLDWAQEMAQQKAILIAGTGYQYADTNFLSFSAKLYTLFAHDLRAGLAGTAVPIGKALVNAKLDYLSGLASVGGIDQKAVIESTLYGLPMTGLNLPGSRTGVPTAPPTVTTVGAATGTAGNVLGLRSADLQFDTPTSAHTTPVLGLNGTPTGANYTWLTGPDGTTNSPAVPALPKQIVNATPDVKASLRGIGFRSGTYTDTPGITPLTGAPTTEQNGVHTTFASPQFFPQNIVSPNYFDALSSSAASGQTSLIVNAAQYRSDASSSSTNTQRAYSHLGVTAFYSGNTTTYGQNTPALSDAPAISQVSTTVSDDLSSVTVSGHVTGDPSAGIQEVWMTYTGEAGPFHGSWASLDLTQNANDSTLWSATLPMPAGQNPGDVRFLLQAVNGVGSVGVDNNLGALYTPGVPVGVTNPGATPTQLHLDPIPSSVVYGSNMTVGATLTGAPAASMVTFDAGDSPVVASTDASGHASAVLPIFGNVGTHVITAVYAGDADHLASSDQSAPFTELKAPTSLVLGATQFTVGSLKTVRAPKAGAAGNVDTKMFATLTTSGQPLTQKSVLFTVYKYGTTTAVVTAVRITDLNGKAYLNSIRLPAGVYTVKAEFGTTSPGSVPDPVYASSLATPWNVVFVPGLVTMRLQ